jgi:tetratricopeptide (TPR) repeat protein
MMKLLLACVIHLTAGWMTAQEMDEFAQDRADIKAAVLEEVKAFVNFDHETWANYWVRIPDPMIVGSDHFGFSELAGWEAFQKSFEDHFKLDDYDYGIEKTNFDIKTDGSSAFLTFDDIISSKSDTTYIDSMKTYAIMLKEDGIWKYMYMHQVSRTSYEQSLANTISSLNWAAWTLFDNLDKQDDALKIMKISEQLDPEHVGVHWYYGEMFGKMGKKQEALDHYKKVLLTYPDNDMVKNRIKALEE